MDLDAHFIVHNDPVTTEQVRAFAEKQINVASFQFLSVGASRPSACSLETVRVSTCRPIGLLQVLLLVALSSLHSGRREHYASPPQVHRQPGGNRALREEKNEASVPLSIHPQLASFLRPHSLRSPRQAQPAERRSAHVGFLSTPHRLPHDGHLRDRHQAPQIRRLHGQRRVDFLPHVGLRLLRHAAPREAARDARARRRWGKLSPRPSCGAPRSPFPSSTSRSAPTSRSPATRVGVSQG